MSEYSFYLVLYNNVSLEEFCCCWNCRRLFVVCIFFFTFFLYSFDTSRSSRAHSMCMVICVCLIPLSLSLNVADSLTRCDVDTFNVLLYVPLVFFQVFWKNGLCVSVIWNEKSRLRDSGNHKVCVISNPNKFCTCYDEMHGDHGGELCLQCVFYVFDIPNVDVCVCEWVAIRWMKVHS